MIGSGKRVLTGLSSLALVLSTVIGVGSAWAQGQNVEPSVNTVINFPGQPNAAGPYITQVTIRPAAVTGTNTDVYVVFSEDIAGGSVDGASSATNTDFIATGFTFASVTAGANWVTLNDASGAGDTDLLQLAAIGVITDDDGTPNPSTDLSVSTLGSGPVIIDVSLSGHLDDDPTNDAIRVEFDDDVQFASGGSVNNTFSLTPEFFPGADPVVLEATWENDPTNDGTFVTITQDGASTVDMNQLKTGVSKLWVDDDRLRWVDGTSTTTNSIAYQIPVQKAGPHLVAAYYVDGGVAGEADDALWLIMSDPIDPASIVGNFLTHFNHDADGGSWAATDGSVAPGFPGAVTTSLIVTNFSAGITAVPIEGTDTISSDGSTDLYDYQGNDALIGTVGIEVGPGVIRASFDDQRSSTRSDDKLLIWINHPLTANAASGDFVFTGFDDTALAYITETVGGLTRITIDGFTSDNYPIAGSRIIPTGTNLVSSISGDVVGAAHEVCVVDESRPYGVDINEDVDLTYDRWDAISSTDSLFIAWSEAGGGDDSDQSFIYFTNSPLNIIDDDWMNSNLQNALPVGNLHPYETDDLTRIGFTVQAGDLTTDGIPLVLGDQIYVIVAAADFQGNVARIQDNSDSARLIGPFIFGPLCAPRDFITDASTPAEPDSAFWDHDVIHVVGDSLDGMVWHYVYGDSGAIPCESDSVIVYDGPDETTANRLGAVVPGPGGSFPPIHLEFDDYDATDCLWVFNRQAEEFSTGTQIQFNKLYPEIAFSSATPYADNIFDPWNPYNLYNADDYVNIRLLANNSYLDCNGANPADGRSALYHIWGDFTQLDMTVGNISGFGTPADSILFTSLGADEVDNDGDWDNFTDVDGNGEWDAGEPLNDDVGLDGVGGTNDPGEGDGAMTFGDPYVDENADGGYDAGETFLNVYTDADGSSGRLIRDPGEPDLDSNDGDEFGWYEVASNSANTRGTVFQGFPLDNPDPSTGTDPFTPVVIYISDNGIDGNERADANDRVLPFVDAVSDSNRSLSHLSVFDGGNPEMRFVATIDLREPTVGELSYLSTETAQGSDGGDNLMAPGSPTYNLGRWVDFTSTTDSDADVLYNRIRIRPSMGAWVDLTLDPGTDSGSTSDANEDHFPGGMEYDEDADSTAAQANAFDEDEDGEADEVGEGIDFSDREVHAASQDSTADEAATYGNGLHAQNDYADNDNDAFFVYDSYANGGLAGGGSVGKIYWYNIDESRSNHFDDDNDGQVDEADEESESIGYGNGENDDNEDGIADGESVLVPIGNAFSVLAISDPVDSRWAAPTAGPGVDAGFIRVDASHVLGQRPSSGNTADTDMFYANMLAYGEIVDAAYEVLTTSVRTFDTEGYDFGGAADSSVTMAFNWFDTHGSENVDFELLNEIYGIVADGETEHQLRAVAVDRSGNEREVWSEPITFTIDLTAPLANIPGCDDSGDPPADFADVRPDDDGIQIYDAGKHTGSYTLTAGADDDAVSVKFEASSDPEFGTIDFTATDVTAPFTAEWPTGGMYNMDNYPAANSDTVYFRASGIDEFGNATAEEDLCVLSVIVIDGTNPIATITQVHDDDDLEDGACVPPDSSIHIFAEIDDNDEIDWVGGLDVAPGVAGYDDDGDGTADEDDVNGDGIYQVGEGVGADGIPGTFDDEWNGGWGANQAVGGGDDNLGETDDYETNDITKVVFEFNPVGDAPDMGWLMLDTIHGDPFSTGDQTIDWTGPVVATWNTIDLETGDYDIRAYACDVEGNCDSLTAFITTVCIRTEPLRAYIQPEVCENTTMFDLYAVHYIHDYEIDRVRFEYFFDMDGDNCATDLDVGSSWVTIALDNADTDRGDAVLYMPSASRVGSAVDAIEDLTYGGDLSASDYHYWDPDNDGYSHRDPVVLDDGDDEFDDDDDTVVIGDGDQIPDGVTLTAFEADEYWADAEGGADDLDATDWIFRENKLTGTNGDLDLWMVDWDATGLEEGNYLTRAIAIDATNQEDIIEYNCYDPSTQNPEEIEAVTVDTDDPDSWFTTITLPDGTEVDISDPTSQQYIAGVNDWLQICVDAPDDIARVLFEYSLDGGVNWTDLDVNNDADFYADIDDVNGYQDGEDEIFNDVDGDFIFTSGVDFVRYAGANGVVDTPDGYPLHPLVGEDDIDGIDDDHDGVVDEDPLTGDPASDEPGSPQDYSAPFCVFVDVENLPLWTDVNVLFRATASDLICENYREDPEPAVVSVIIGENMAPEADVIRAEDQDGVELDVFPSVMDDSGVVCIGADTETMSVFVTAEDVTAIVEVDLYYRLDPSCYPDMTFEDKQWKSMADAGWTAIDTEYPYDFVIDMTLVDDGAYQFFPRALDEGGNSTEPPTNPWAFKVFDLATDEFAFVSDPAPGSAPTAAVGDEYLITAELADPSYNETTAVRFYYAARVLDEAIDPTLVQPLVPFVSPVLDAEVLSEIGVCDGVIVMVNGELATCYESLDGVPAPTVLDVAVDTSGGDSRIVFGARPAADDVVTVSYNFGSWILIGDGDEFDPYTVEWSNADGGVPVPANVGLTDAYDLIATARFDLNGDWLFGGDCDVDESRASEGNHLMLLDLDRPKVHVWGLAYSEEPRENQGAYPDWNTPGNPLFTCGDDDGGSTDWDHAFILSGKETDVFVTAADEGGGSIVSVDLAISSENPEDGSTRDMSWPMDEVGTTATTLDVPVTFYPSDWVEYDIADIENVILYVSTDGGGTYPYKWEMTEGVDCFQVDARLFVDTTHHYEFEIDLVGDTQARVYDARNNDGSESQITLPETPFWYVNIDGSADLYPAGVHRVVATATDDSGNEGTNLNSDSTESSSPQGPVIFIYDVEEPFVDAISITDTNGTPLRTDRVTTAETYELWSAVNDNPYEDFNVLRVDAVVFQYSPNMGEAWVNISTDTNTANGWSSPGWTPVDPTTDGYDNDNDGLYDEEDEKIAEYWIRTIAFDCGFNTGYSDAQDPAVLLVLTVDVAQPTTCPTSPNDGAVYGYDASITIAGIPSGDDLGAQGSSDIAEMRFQARYSNLFYVDETFNSVGHAGDYDNGIDEIWLDTNSDGLFDGGDTNMYPGADGSASAPDGNAAKNWFTLDPTPQDNSDDPWLSAANNGDEFTMAWTPVGSLFTEYGIDSSGGYIDEYVRIRMVAKDTAGNTDNGDDDNPPCEKLIILNDTADNNPRAYVMEIDGAWVDPVEIYCIAGDGDVEVEGTIGANAAVSHVNVYIAQDGGDRLIGVDNVISGLEFSILWDAEAEVAGTYTIFATVVDHDDNETPLDEATRIQVKLDREGPSVDYTDWVSSVEYIDDGIADHSSFAIHPDPETWDLFFTVSTTDADVQTITLQWRNAEDPEGLWRPLSTMVSGISGDAFDYEPNLNFEDGGETHHVWRYHVEDFPEVLIATGPMHLRALAADQAGNTNALQLLSNAQELTADAAGPTLYDWNDDSVTNQVEVGSTTNFEISSKDDWTDVVATQLWYRNVTDSGSWTFYAADEAPAGVQIDTGEGLWVSNYAWVAPDWVVHDTVYEFRLVGYDSAWNEATNTPPHAFNLTVEDNAAPENTKIVDVLAEVAYTSESGSAPDPTADHREHDVWVDMDGSEDYTTADYLISEGDNTGVDDGDAINGLAFVGDAGATYPRQIGEGFLNDAADRNEAKVARTVTVVGRTWADDDGIDSGVSEVTFWAIPLDGSDEPMPAIMITKDEVAPNFPLYYWHVTWNTMALDTGGNRIFPDGRYRLAAHAMDQEGNVEDVASMEMTSAIIVVDNVAPEGAMDADPATAALENEITVERNEWFTLFSRVLEPGTTNEIAYEDDTVTWYFKRSRDLNLTDSWGMVPVAAGQTPEDGNPDMTRPYSFDVLVGELTEPTDPTNDPALAVGESYDFMMQVQDEVMNTNTHIALFDDNETIGPRHLTVNIVDTIAPHLEIVSAVRGLPTRDGIEYGDDDAIANPTQVQAQAFESISARLLTGHRDLEYVEFVWRPMGTTDWNLIDADLSSADGINWTLGDWDLRALGAGSWLEVAAIGVDDIGNADQDLDIMKVYVDYEAPDFAVTSPDPMNTFWCDYEYTDPGRIMDLITSVVRGDGDVHDDVYDVIFEWKLSSADSTNWSASGVATSDDLYDDTLNSYSNTLDLNDLAGSNLYDLRVTVVDEAGNTNSSYQWKRTVDVDDPDYVIISNIAWEGDDTTQDPSDQGQYTDVTAGTLVEIFGTASDDEDALPNYADPQTGQVFETGVGYLQFEVTYDESQDGDANDGEIWRDLGTVVFDPDDLGDISAQTGSVLWNTTGLADGQYLVRVGAKDVCGNPVEDWTYSAVTNVRIVDNEPPVARIICWDADQQPHGVNPPSWVAVYALTESDPDIEDVLFQYNVVDAGETSPTGDWVNFGIQSEETGQDSHTTQSIWYSGIEPTDFDDTVTSLWLRALAKDEQGNRYGDNPEDIVPTIQVNIVEAYDGTVTFEPVRSADMENGSAMVENVEVMIESNGNMIVTVDMATADQSPRMIVLAEETAAQTDDYPSYDNPVNYSPGVEGGLIRSLDDNTVWRAEIFLSDDDCFNYKLCVSALDGEAGTAKWIDLTGAEVNEYYVTPALGTNGVVMTTAHDSLGVYVDAHPGAVEDAGCLLVSPTWPPLVSHDQAMNLNAVDNSAYHIELRAFDDDDAEFVHGYEPMVTIMFADLGDEAEGNLTVRRWNEGASNNDGTSGAWTQSGISQIQVDGAENTVSFRIANLDLGVVPFGGGSDWGDATGTVFQLFTLSDSAPVLFSTVWPASPYVLDWWTDADPVITMYLRDPGGEGVDADEIELLIDGEYWATWLSGAGDADWIRGNGTANVEIVNSTGTAAQLTYHHSNYTRDWLADGEHTLTARFRSTAGEWLDGTQTFYVDRTSPYIEFDGGFVSNPDIINAQGYMNPAGDSLQVSLFDAGSGIMVKPNRLWFLPDFDCDGNLDPDELQFDPTPYEYYPQHAGGYDPDDRCFHRVDWGMKYDLWLVDTEDDQRDIDEIEERILIHQGTADELVPWINPRLENYTPADDTLRVPVPVLGGGMIGHGDILEVVWYSEKTIERYSDGSGYDYGCGVDTVTVGGSTYYIYDGDCTYDRNSQEMHIYEQGILDWAGNTGSKYVEQRFIVDMMPPDCQILSPSSTVSPNGDLDLHIVIADDGAGINDGSITVEVVDPEGTEVDVVDMAVENGVVTGSVAGPLAMGEYTVKVSASDRLGNDCNIVKTVSSQNANLALTEVYAFPNPFNPAETNGTIHFNLSRDGEVTVKIYDFGGEYVATVSSSEMMSAGDVQFEWGGEAADGTDLANGTYIAHVLVTDGNRTEETNLKVVLWRE